MHRFARLFAFMAILSCGHLSIANGEAPSFFDETWHDAARDRDVPVRIYLPADASKPAPAILVSHGLGDSRDAMAYACNAWVADQFVVVALEHAGSDWHLWDKHTTKPGEAMKRLQAAATPKNFLLRCGDVRFALDELARQNAGTGRLAGRIDLEHLGLAGHSFGALTAQALLGERFAPDAGAPATLADPRIKAAVIMSPGVEGAMADSKAAFGSITTPALYLTGTADSTPGLGITLTSRRRVPFDGATQSDRYLVTFNRGDHIVFSGHQPRWADATRYEHVRSSVARLSTDFWNLTLRGDASAAARLSDRSRAGLDEADKFEHRAAETSPTTQPAED